ncbi:CRISPR-associated protein Csx20 [Aliarcobacter cryaerophilus]|uniref:CRISPR-associated protein Csx20 n=1 Tax=Aliarcobacter cryaerophilus TaxID=28198 RepID=UPI0021B43BAF|nr:CRISPR-associated protein Csx20 [Aliarcobacter cryaerophilus]MCT7464784.1 CRISPR-associated protein Csx20 [Aliarcobacter cryaerophilus]
MKKMFLLFSHKLTKQQQQDAIKTFEIEEFQYLPKDLQFIFSNIPSNLTSLEEYLIPLKTYLKDNAKNHDIVLIQGDFGAVYQMVNFSKSLGLTSVYSTTNRIIEEVFKDGKTIKKSIFEHVMFRRYI